MTTNIYFQSYLAQFCLESKIFKTEAVKKFETRIFAITFFSRNSYRLVENVGKYCRSGQATDDSMAYAQCMLDT